MKKRVLWLVLILVFGSLELSASLNLNFHVVREENGWRDFAVLTLQNNGPETLNQLNIVFQPIGNGLRALVQNSKAPALKTDVWPITKGFIYSGTARIFTNDLLTETLETNNLISKGLLLPTLKSGDKLMICAFWEDPAGPYTAYLEKKVGEELEVVSPKSGRAYITPYDLVWLSFSAKIGAPYGQLQYWEVWLVGGDVKLAIPPHLAIYPNYYGPGRYVFTAVISTPDLKIYTPSFLVEVSSQ